MVDAVELHETRAGDTRREISALIRGHHGIGSRVHDEGRRLDLRQPVRHIEATGSVEQSCGNLGRGSAALQLDLPVDVIDRGTGHQQVSENPVKGVYVAAPAEAHEFQQRAHLSLRLRLLQCVAVRAATVDQQVRDPFGMPCRVFDRDRRPVGHAEQCNLFEACGIDHTLHVSDQLIERQTGRGSVGQPRTARVMTIETVVHGQQVEPVPPGWALPVELQVAEPHTGRE